MIQIDRHHEAMALHQDARNRGDYQAAVVHLQEAIRHMRSAQTELNAWLHGAYQDLCSLKAALTAKKEPQRCSIKKIA